MDAELVRAKALLQAGDDVAVDLNYMQMIQTLQQRIGKRTQAGADLDNTIGALRCNGIDDIGNDLLINQKILPKPFACDVLAHAFFL